MGGAPGGLMLGLVTTEVCAPLILLCLLCCWPDDNKSDTSSGNHPTRPVVAHEAASRRRSSDFFGRRLGSSAISLHLPSTSGHKKLPLSAHRSHEEIGSRRKSHIQESQSPETRYHSAPSVIDEVLHRRDWDRSVKELHIPLKPTNIEYDIEGDTDDDSDASISPPHAEPESSSIEELKAAEPTKPCKKHHANIKSSRGRKAETKEDCSKKEIKSSIEDKDSDATESNFYIGETKEDNSMLKNSKAETLNVQKASIYKAKEAKQSFNETLKSKERPRQTLVPVDEHHPRLFQFSLDDVIEQLDRSGAVHHSIESRTSVGRPILPPPSVEAVGYEWEGGACCLAEAGDMATLRSRRHANDAVTDERPWRARHASDGDILAPPLRPESGAFSESDLDLELEASEERPPAYHELHDYTSADNKETAI